MASPVVLKKGKLSIRMLKKLETRYTGADGGAYMEARWRGWKERPEIAVYRAFLQSAAVGWVVYDPSRSTVEEICLEGEDAGKDLEARIMDALLERESLIAVEIRKDDPEKYNRMVEYGFRPVRTFMHNGISMVRMDLSTAVLLEKTKGMKPAGKYRKKERVVVERVPASQTYEEVKAGLERVLKGLGGLTKFVKPGQRVVIKPNVVSDHGLRNGIYTGGIVTDLKVVKALTEILLPVAGEVIIAEGSSINRSETSRMYAHYGYDTIPLLDEKRVRLVDLNADGLVEKAVPGGKRMMSRKVPVTLEQADVIISVPVLKIHFAAIVSLAVKHLQGAVPPIEKYMTHFFGLWQNLVNIHHLVKPALTIIDGLTGLEDFGPVSGVPKKMDLLIGGVNPVAVDAVAMRIMGLDPASSPPVWLAYMQGLGPIEEELITLVGPPVEEVRSPFVQPVIDLTGGRDITIHAERACPGCRGYLHFVLSKLRRPDPLDESRLLMDRPFDRKVNIYLGPGGKEKVNREERNIFMGLCRQHQEDAGTFLPGCPPHAEVIMNGIFGLFPDVERPVYADKTEETKLGEMLDEILSMNKS